MTPLFTIPWSIAWASPSWSPEQLVRVDDPAHPEAIARSKTGAVLASPPSDDTPWRLESVPEIDRVELDQAGSSQLLQAIGADAWHAAGRTGAGVAVAVFDLSWFAGGSDPTGLDPTTHDCFVSTTCAASFDPEQPSLTTEFGGHGWACTEILHEVAPDAELHLVRVNTLTTLENAADWAIREGIDVISMSMSFYNDSFYDGTGPHAELLERLEDAGVLLVTSAGNNALQHAASTWLDADADDVDDGAGQGGWWVYWGAGTQTLYLNWDQWGEACGTTDLSVRVLDERGWVVAEADRNQDPEASSCEPVERLNPTLPEPGWVFVEIARERGPTTGLRYDLLARRGTVLNGTPWASGTDPGQHPFALSVGAVRVSDYAGGPIAPYSAQGSHGAAPKPDLVGPDGLTNSTFGPAGFFGTSASTPAVAGMAALWLAEEPDLGPADVRERLRAGAQRDHAGFEPDPAFGAGRARLPRPDPGVVACGQRPLLLPFLLLFTPWWRRGRRAG